MVSGTHVGMPMTGTVALLALIVDSSDGAIVSETLDGPIAGWNRAAERMYGYSAEEFVGESISLLIAEGGDEMVGILGEMAAGKRVDYYRTTRLRKDGTSVPMSLAVSPESTIGDGAIARAGEGS
jgi:PAS domain S-box-containing protein